MGPLFKALLESPYTVLVSQQTPAGRVVVTYILERDVETAQRLGWTVIGPDREVLDAIRQTIRHPPGIAHS